MLFLPLIRISTKNISAKSYSPVISSSHVEISKIPNRKHMEIHGKHHNMSTFMVDQLMFDHPSTVLATGIQWNAWPYLLQCNVCGSLLVEFPKKLFSSQGSEGNPAIMVCPDIFSKVCQFRTDTDTSENTFFFGGRHLSEMQVRYGTTGCVSFFR